MPGYGGGAGGDVLREGEEPQMDADDWNDMFGGPVVDGVDGQDDGERIQEEPAGESGEGFDKEYDLMEEGVIPRCIRRPTPPAEADVAQYSLTHLPYRGLCPPHCVWGRGAVQPP